MKVHVAGAGNNLSAVRERVRLLEEAGVDGVFTGDHLFFTHGRPRSEAFRGGEAFAPLAVVGTLSERLMLGTSVVNIGFLHPALVIRQFMQLAALFGGERVLAGIGAGWNGEEFQALGMPFPPFADRMNRLEEACQLTRMVFDHGFASLAGDQVAAVDLPLGPAVESPPRLMLGGGSDRLLEIAGRFADVIDLNGSSRREKLRGPQPAARDMARRLTTTISDLEDSVQRVRIAAVSAGRTPETVEMSIVVNAFKICVDSDVPAVEEQICRAAGIDAMPLERCPYALVGSVERMRALWAERVERIGLKHVILGGLSYEDIVRFKTQVAHL
jgi:alkanesulfonate monooxygenase SsuD/methylene tetrahydromethanopterin reductase-like flavin-dependent oxidoreductase (luciferase family)